MNYIPASKIVPGMTIRARGDSRWHTVTRVHDLGTRNIDIHVTDGCATFNADEMIFATILPAVEASWKGHIIGSR